ncbi:unnamed protein product [Cunninghamella echinulata]
MIIRLLLLFIFILSFSTYSLAYPPLLYQSKEVYSSEKDEIEYAPFQQQVQKNKTNTTIKVSTDLPICTYEDIPSDYTRKKNDLFKTFNSIITTPFHTLKHYTLSAVYSIKTGSIKLKDSLQTHIKNNYLQSQLSDGISLLSTYINNIYIDYIQPISGSLSAINLNVHTTIWSWMDNVDETKENIIQTLEDIYLSPALEWHLIWNKMNRKWMTFCRYLGVDSHVRHLYRKLIKPQGSTATTAHSHLDDIFKDMLETEYHSQFYQQQMTNYFQSLPYEEQINVQYSKRDFIQWVKDGEFIWHEFVDQMQHEWIILMQSLYQDFEKIIHCLFSSPPNTLNKISCSFKQGRGLSLYTSPTTTTKQQQKNKKDAYHLHLHFWQHELLTLSKELEKTAKCICSHTYDSTIPSNNVQQHSNIKMKTTKTPIHQQTPILSKNQKIPFQQQKEEEQQISKYLPNNHSFLKKHPIQEVIDTLTRLQKEKSKQFTRIDKHLQRQLFELTPPRSHQPIHLFYERLRDNVSAKNKSTFHKYLTQLLYSWNFIMSNTLDITTTIIDDLKWLQEKQQLEKSTSLNQEQFKESLELLWASSRRKLEKNNIQLVQQWETIFINMDHEIQEAWDDMLVMVDSSHRSSFEKVKQFWSENKSRLSKFFSNIFYSNTMDPIE